LLPPPLQVPTGFLFIIVISLPKVYNILFGKNAKLNNIEVQRKKNDRKVKKKKGR